MVTKREPARRRPKTRKIPPGPRREDYTNVWEWMMAFSDSIPDSAWKGVPTDASSNFDHYVDGVPKQHA